MAKVVSIGNQSFKTIRENKYFYIDKTYFIKEWWESADNVTLITRPRRFGKTLNMSMLDCFFSNRYKGRSDLFEGLSIWKDEKYRKLQGTYPVIFLSFAAVKAGNLEDAKKQIKMQIEDLYEENRFLLQENILSEGEREQYLSVNADMDDVYAEKSLNKLCNYLSRYYGKNVIILLDEYDTPMQEAYLGGYWDEFIQFVRSLFNAAFKTNPYLERAVMTGITRVSKESVFSDLNNLMVVTTTSNQYSTCFGFTEDEVFGALEEMGLSEEKERVKDWYDGFAFGNRKDIYNPWSITNFLKQQKYETYWAATSSNELVGRMVQTASADVKKMMEQLIKGGTIEVTLDEQIVFDQLDKDEEAIWSLILASGYLKVENLIETDSEGDILDFPKYELKLTNREVRNMFYKLFKGWFGVISSNYNDFVKALLKGNLKEMNFYMNEVSLATFSSFDTGKHPSEKLQPERFYHGFVLGLLVELRNQYEVSSNGESGLGRYDVMLIPRKADNADTPAIVLEFKVHEPDEEKTLKDTVESALNQIKEKKYDIKLLEHGISKENIRHYGFAFEGKKVLIG